MKYYVDHNCSITVHVRDNEWDDVEEWVWQNWDDIVALSFLSYDDNFYELVPYEAITKEEYDNWLGTNSNKYNSDELHHITMLKSLKEIGTNKNLIINNDFIIIKENNNYKVDSFILPD